MQIQGPTIRLSSGRYFNLITPDSMEFDIDDIASALSNLCRFTGHCKTFYSVAQHSVMVSNIVPDDHALHGLLHDAAEAYIGDVSSPLKKLLPDFKAIEKSVETALFTYFKLPDTLPMCVKQADLVLLRTEQRDLMQADDDAWSVTEGILPLDETITPLPPHIAKELFLDRYYKLLSCV